MLIHIFLTLTKASLKNMRMFRKTRPCVMCVNARNDSRLTERNDFSSFMIGSSKKGSCITFSSGGGKSPVIEFRMWDDVLCVFNIIGTYNPKFCPNCGRKIDEYK